MCEYTRRLLVCVCPPNWGTQPGSDGTRSLVCISGSSSSLLSELLKRAEGQVWCWGSEEVVCLPAEGFLCVIAAPSFHFLCFLFFLAPVKSKVASFSERGS